MCGICCIFGSVLPKEALLAKCLEAAKSLRHRGPDWTGSHVYKDPITGGYNVMAHERLALVDLMSGMQPVVNNDRTVYACVNGEIYNHHELRSLLDPQLVESFNSQSDSQIVPYLFKKLGPDFVSLLDGMFAFVVVDESTGEYMAARDQLGICPLYVGYHTDGSVWFASEMKCLIKYCARVELFPPGHYFCSSKGELKQYFDPDWLSPSLPVPRNASNCLQIRQKLEQSVNKMLMCEVPFGIVLSGSVDSALLAAISSRASKRTHVAEWYRDIHTFSVGLAGSPDMVAARKVAEFLGTRHFELIFKPQEGIAALQDVIYHIESYDVETVRSSVPLYLLSRLVKSLGVKMILSGEGADEIFGGHSFFDSARTGEELYLMIQRKLKLLHQFDLMRANKATMATGIELRLPFLDLEFIKLIMDIDPREKLCDSDRIEKFILREAFSSDENGNPYIPHEILWRPRQRYSLGVSDDWVASLVSHAEQMINDTQMSRAALLFPYNSPTTKEGYLYRCIFTHMFPLSSATKTIAGSAIIGSSLNVDQFREQVKNPQISSFNEYYPKSPSLSFDLSGLIPRQA